LAQSDGPLYAHVDLARRELAAACQSAGFEIEVESKRYEVPVTAFGPERSRLASNIQLLRADQVDASALFRLDETLRQDVPGLNGWVGDRAAFDKELVSDTYDPSGYLVAQHNESGELLGLIRFWRDDPSPKLGLLGVVPSHRRGVLAHALLAQGLAAVSRWGSLIFTTHTARPSLQRRLEARGAVCTGSFTQMVHR